MRLERTPPAKRERERGEREGGERQREGGEREGERQRERGGGGIGTRRCLTVM